MDPADRELLASSVAAAIDGEAPADANDDALRALGWADMLAAEPVDAVAVVFGRLGRSAARSTVLDDVVAGALGLPVGVAMVHPTWDALEPTTGPEGDVLRIHGTAGPRAAVTERVHVLTGDGVAVMDATALAIAPAHPDSEFRAVMVDGSPSEWRPIEREAIDAAVTAARRALAHRLHGVAAGMLALARDHAVDRMQFGRPIASFQAVRHKLAETLVAVDAAADALSVADEGSGLAVDLARVLAGRAALDAGRHCQQVLAGIGFTRDHPFHRHLFATIGADGLYGTTATLTRHVGERLLDTRDVPRVVDL